MSEQRAVLLEQKGAALWITINRPEKRNALNHEVIAGIGEGYRKADGDPGIRVIVLTGAGERAFCAGGDLQPGQVLPSITQGPAPSTPTCCGWRRTALPLASCE